MDATFTWPTSDAGSADADEFGLFDGFEPACLNTGRAPPTPPTSNPITPPDDRSRLVSISTTFFAAAQLDALPPDLILLSADSVFFNVHAHKLLGASSNAFHQLLPASVPERRGTDPILHLAEDANTVNLLLHAIYGLSCAHYAPDFDMLALTLKAFPKYGLQPTPLVDLGTPLFECLLALAPARPLDVYTLAAGAALDELAVRASAHLLSLSLANVSDAHATAMGALYLKRLFFLHLGRADALKRLLLVPPADHLPTAACGRNERAQLQRAWALASAYLAWESRPDVLPSTIEAAVKPLGDGITCDRCRAALVERLQTLITQWSMVKRTI